MGKFKVGDRVEKQNSKKYNKVKNGETGEITSINNSNTKVYVNWDNHYGEYHYYVVNNSIKLKENNNTMEEFYVEVTPQLSKILQQIAFEEGYSWDYTREQEQVISYTLAAELGFNYIQKRIYYAPQNYHKKYDDHKDIPKLEDFTLGEFRDALRNGIEEEPEPIKICGHEVEFYKDRIDVGCTSFDNEDVIDLFHLMERNSIEYIIMKLENIEVSLDKIKEIYKRLEK